MLILQQTNPQFLTFKEFTITSGENEFLYEVGDPIELHKFSGNFYIGGYDRAIEISNDFDKGILLKSVHPAEFVEGEDDQGSPCFINTLKFSNDSDLFKSIISRITLLERMPDQLFRVTKISSGANLL